MPVLRLWFKGLKEVCTFLTVKQYYLFSKCFPSLPASGYNKDSRPAAGAAEEDGDFQCAPGNQQDAEDGPREAGTGVEAGSGQSESHAWTHSVSPCYYNSFLSV